MGSNGKANKNAEPGKDPVIKIENKMAKIDPMLESELEVKNTKDQIAPSECESTKGESCYVKCGKALHSKPAQVRLILTN